MQIILCDDSKNDRQLLREYIEAYSKGKHIFCEITEVQSGESLLQLQNIVEYDVVFMDIYMGNLNGIETSKRLLEQGYSGCFIFTTSSTEHVFASFAFDVLDYLVKPFSTIRLEKTMDKLCRVKSDMLLTISVLVNGFSQQIPVCKIVSIETNANHSTLIHMQNTTICSQTLISDLEQMLSSYPNFLRCHRSYIINLNEVSGVENTTVYMTNHTKALLVQRSSSEFKKKINDYLWKNMMDDSDSK